ncbi:MAG: DNA repair protein [Pseudomonadota bacterium]
MYDFATRAIIVGQLIAMLVFSIAGLALLIATGLAVAGVLPWIELSIAFAGQQVAWAGQAAQISVTALFLLLSLYVPTNRHVMMLEATHRDFAVSMDDITQAYQAVHLADRRKAFDMTREFDSVRERFEYLRTHPELPDIDAELLTVAAQMSHQSRELARDFAEDRVTRAEEALKQRRDDAVELQARIQAANAASFTLRREIEDVEFEESSAASQMRRLREELLELEARIGLRTANKIARHLRPVQINDAS